MFETPGTYTAYYRSRGLDSAKHSIHTPDGDLTVWRNDFGDPLAVGHENAALMPEPHAGLFALSAL
jgi:hypothetical protein